MSTTEIKDFEKVKAGRVSSSLLSIIFFFLILYNSHRYIFKYNQVSTSPNYENTPWAWQIGKYVTLIILLLLIYISNKYTLIRVKIFELILLLLAFILSVNVLNFTIYGELFADELEYVFFFLILTPFVYIKESIMDYIVQKLDSAFNFTSIFFVTTNLFVTANYWITGRLPALAYEGLIVRFGGLWDDPNGFGVISVFLFFWSYFKRKYLLAFCLLLCVVSTLSISSILIFLVSLVYWSKINYAKLSKAVLTLVSVLMIGGIFVITLLWTRIVDMLQYKVRSIEAHTTFSIKFSILPLLNGPLQFHETWMASFFVNYFPVSFIVIILFIYFLFKTFFNRQKNFIEYYLFIFIIGNFFVPFIYDFPLNFIFILFLIICSRQFHKKLNDQF